MKSLSVSLGPDEYGAILSIRDQVDALSSQIAANRQAIEAANLTAEQENAELLGLLNEIKVLIDSLRPVSPAPPLAKLPPRRHITSPLPRRVVRQQ